ncbi:hypothetical protein AURDEDRAFT_156454 [Auricularia subglabra TFB-10046 SS5]|nr:hypothetical protein AURDEDRAFT_156454 [Auricularia subglabra TFB-10046 SS5]
MNGAKLTCNFIPAHPEIGARVEKIRVYYLLGREEEWPGLDIGLTSLSQLQTLTLYTLEGYRSSRPPKPTGKLLDKLAEVALRQAQISSSLRELNLKVLLLQKQRDALGHSIAYIAPRAPSVTYPSI